MGDNKFMKSHLNCVKDIERLSDGGINALFYFLHMHAMHLLIFLNNPNLQWKTLKLYLSQDITLANNFHFLLKTSTHLWHI